MPLKNSLSPRLWIAEGLLNKSNWNLNFFSSQIGLNLFERCLAKSKLLASHVNIWNFDQGKLLIPSVFMGCDQTTKVMRIQKGESGKIRTLSVVTPFSKESFKIAYFKARTKKICRTLCRVLEEGEEDLYPWVSYI